MMRRDLLIYFHDCRLKAYLTASLENKLNSCILDAQINNLDAS